MADMNKNYKHEDLSYDKQISKINTVVTDKFDLLGCSEVNYPNCYQPDI
jgi:predicted nucleic-acid-binding Zn-ribbon protein